LLLREEIRNVEETLVKEEIRGGKGRDQDW